MRAFSPRPFSSKCGGENLPMEGNEPQRPQIGEQSQYNYVVSNKPIQRTNPLRRWKWHKATNEKEKHGASTDVLHTWCSVRTNRRIDMKSGTHGRLCAWHCEFSPNQQHSGYSFDFLYWLNADLVINSVNQLTRKLSFLFWKVNGPMVLWHHTSHVYFNIIWSPSVIVILFHIVAVMFLFKLHRVQKERKTFQRCLEPWL